MLSQGMRGNEWGEHEQQYRLRLQCPHGKGGVGRHGAMVECQPGTQLADQYESDMLCCCHEGQRSQVVRDGRHMSQKNSSLSLLSGIVLTILTISGLYQK